MFVSLKCVNVHTRQTILIQGQWINVYHEQPIKSPFKE